MILVRRRECDGHVELTVVLFIGVKYTKKYHLF